MSMIYDPETGEYIREEELRERRLKQHIEKYIEDKLRELLRELIEEHEIEITVNIEEGTGIGRYKRRQRQ